MRPIGRAIAGALALGVGLSALAGACSSGGSGGSYRLTGGAYTWFASSVTANSCWAPGAGIPPVNISFPATVSTAGAANAVTLTLTTSLSNIIASPLPGTVVGSLVTTTGSSTFVVSTGCHLALVSLAFGPLTGNGAAELEIDTTITGVSLLGTASNCNAYSGGNYPGTAFPFPTLLGGSNGACSYGEKGPLTHS